MLERGLLPIDDDPPKEYMFKRIKHPQPNNNKRRKHSEQSEEDDQCLDYSHQAPQCRQLLRFCEKLESPSNFTRTTTIVRAGSMAEKNRVCTVVQPNVKVEANALAETSHMVNINYRHTIDDVNDSVNDESDHYMNDEGAASILKSSLLTGGAATLATLNAAAEHIAQTKPTTRTEIQIFQPTAVLQQNHTQNTSNLESKRLMQLVENDQHEQRQQSAEINRVENTSSNIQCSSILQNALLQQTTCKQYLKPTLPLTTTTKPSCPSPNVLKTAVTLANFSEIATARQQQQMEERIALQQQQQQRENDNIEERRIIATPTIVQLQSRTVSLGAEPSATNTAQTEIPRRPQQQFTVLRSTTKTLDSSESTNIRNYLGNTNIITATTTPPTTCISYYKLTKTKTETAANNIISNSNSLGDPCSATLSTHYDTATPPPTTTFRIPTIQMSTVTTQTDNNNTEHNSDDFDDNDDNDQMTETQLCLLPTATATAAANALPHKIINTTSTIIKNSSDPSPSPLTLTTTDSMHDSMMSSSDTSSACDTFSFTLSDSSTTGQSNTIPYTTSSLHMQHFIKKHLQKTQKTVLPFDQHKTTLSPESESPKVISAHKTSTTTTKPLILQHTQQYAASSNTIQSSALLKTTRAPVTVVVLQTKLPDD